MSYEADATGTVLVIGYGSPLRGDDQAGRITAGELARLGFTSRVLTQLTPELAADIAGFRRVIFLDASVAVEPGEIAVEPIGPGRHAAPFEHHLTPGGLLQLAAGCYGWRGEAWLIALGTEQYELGTECSAAAGRAIAKAIEKVRKLAAESGAPHLPAR